MDTRGEETPGACPTGSGCIPGRAASCLRGQSYRLGQSRPGERASAVALPGCHRRGVLLSDEEPARFLSAHPALHPQQVSLTARIARMFWRAGFAGPPMHALSSAASQAQVASERGVRPACYTTRSSIQSEYWLETGGVLGGRGWWRRHAFLSLGKHMHSTETDRSPSPFHFLLARPAVTAAGP